MCSLQKQARTTVGLPTLLKKEGSLESTRPSRGVIWPVPPKWWHFLTNCLAADGGFAFGQLPYRESRSGGILVQSAFPPIRSYPLALGFLPLDMAGAYVLCTLCSLIQQTESFNTQVVCVLAVTYSYAYWLKPFCFKLWLGS